VAAIVKYSGVAAAALVVAAGVFGFYRSVGAPESELSGTESHNQVEVASPVYCARLFTVQCLPLESQYFNTIADAAAIASFEPSLPRYIPGGFALLSVQHSRPQGTSASVQSGQFKLGCPDCNPRFSHNDQIGITYTADDGSVLIIIQGFPAYLPFQNDAPRDRWGVISVGSREAVWVSGWPGNWQSGQTAIYFNLGRTGTGWEHQPPGVTVSGSPISYSITSDSLSLEELIKVAESVEFP
jgi:hypothetical protein